MKRKGRTKLWSLLFILVILMGAIPAVNAAESYLWPVPAKTTITAGRGYSASHKGIDIGGTTSCNIVATKSGTVVCAFTGCNNKNAAATGTSCSKSTCNYSNPDTVGGVNVCNYGYGRGVVVQHSDGTYSCYAHMSTVAVKKGAVVKQGQVLGKMGNYGYANGVHLHFSLSSGSWWNYNVNSNPSNIKYVYSTPYKIAYNANGGSGTIASSEVVANNSFTIASSGFSRSGYVLAGYNVYRSSDKRWYTSGGWATNAEITSGGYTKKQYSPGATYTFDYSWAKGASSGDTYTFYAVWAQGDYNIVFNANEGTGTMSPAKIKQGDTFTVSECAFTREGYHFIGWNVIRTSNSGWYIAGKGWLNSTELKNNGYEKRLYTSGEELSFDESWTNGASAGDTYTFYAIWAKDTPSLSFYNNESGVNYIASGIAEGDLFDKTFISRAEDIYTISIDSTERLNKQNSLKIVGTAAGSINKDMAFVTQTNKGCCEWGGATDNKKMTLTFWAKSSVDGAKMNLRWGYTSDLQTITLSTSWKKYTVDMSKNIYDGQVIHPFFDRAGTFYINNLCLTDNSASNELFSQESTDVVEKRYYDYDGVYSELPIPERAGYTFLGWYTAKVGGEQITEDTNVLPDDTYVYARWTKDFSFSYNVRLQTRDGKVYELYDNAVSWEEAKELCEENGGHLVTINSEEENELVHSFISNDTRIAWIGAYQDEETGDWRWVTDEPFGYTNWLSGEPSSSESLYEPFAHMYPVDIGTNRTSSKWNDILGSTSQLTYYSIQNSCYICEYEQEPPEEPIVTKDIYFAPNESWLSYIDDYEGSITVAGTSTTDDTSMVYIPAVNITDRIYHAEIPVYYDCVYFIVNYGLSEEPEEEETDLYEIPLGCNYFIQDNDDYFSTGTWSEYKPYCSVAFVDWDGTLLSMQTVNVGAVPTAPENPTRKGYNFVGWDAEFDSVIADMTIKAVYEKIPTTPTPAPTTGALKVEVVGGTSFTIAIDGGNARPQGPSYMNSKMPIGASVTVKASSASGAEFIGWQNSVTGAVLSTDPEYTFLASGNDSIKAMFAVKIEGVQMVTFKNSKAGNFGRVLDSQYYAQADAISFPDAPTQVGYDFAGWSMTEAEIQSAIANGEDVTVVANWTKALVPVDVTVNGGTGSGTYYANNAVTVTANEAPAGQKFAYWTDAQGSIRSYNAEYKFFPTADTTLTAVFVAEDEVIDYEILVSMDSIDTVSVADKNVFYYSWYCPEEYTFVKAGVVAVNKDNYNESTFTAGSSDSNVYDRGPSGTSLKPVNTYSWTKSNVTSGQTWMAKAYVQYKDASGAIITVYSDVVEATKE